MTLEQINKQLKCYTKALQKALKAHDEKEIQELEQKVETLTAAKQKNKQYFDSLDINELKSKMHSEITKEGYKNAYKLFKEKKAYDKEKKQLSYIRRKRIKIIAITAASIAIPVVSSVLGFFGMKFSSKNKGLESDKEENIESTINIDNQSYDDKILNQTGVSEEQIDSLVDNTTLENTNNKSTSSGNNQVNSSDNNESNNRVLYTTTQQPIVIKETITENEVILPPAGSTTIKEEIITTPVENNYGEITSEPEDKIDASENIPAEEQINDGGTYEEEAPENNPTDIEEDKSDEIYYDNANEDYILSTPGEEQTTDSSEYGEMLEGMPIEEDESDITYYVNDENQITYYDEDHYTLVLK